MSFFSPCSASRSGCSMISSAISRGRYLPSAPCAKRRCTAVEARAAEVTAAKATIQPSIQPDRGQAVGIDALRMEQERQRRAAPRTAPPAAGRSASCAVRAAPVSAAHGDDREAQAPTASTGSGLGSRAPSSICAIISAWICEPGRRSCGRRR